MTPCDSASFLFWNRRLLTSGTKFGKVRECHFYANSISFLSVFLFILWYLTFKSLICVLNSTQVPFPNAPERNVELKNQHQTNKTHSLLQSDWSQINTMSNPINSLTMYIPRSGEAGILGVRCKARIPKTPCWFYIWFLNCGFQISEHLDVTVFKFPLGRLLLWFSFQLKKNLNSQRTGSSFCCVSLIIIILKLSYSASFPTGCKVPSSPDNTCHYPKLTEEWTQDQTQNPKWSRVHAGLPGVPKGTLSGKAVGYTRPRQEMWGFQNRTQNLS